MRFLKALLALLILLAAAIGLAYATTPRLHWLAGAEVAAVVPGADLDAWLTQHEGVFDDITTGTEKHITWAGEPGARTSLALVYLHGYSATRQEISPVPERLAQALGANLFATRFAGHGRSGAALAEATPEDWATDLAEAMAIAARLGDRVVLIGTSTGASIATLAALDPAYRDAIAALVMVSPNFELNNPQAFLLHLPYAERWVPLVVGETRSWEPQNDGQARYWTSSYPTRALFAMRAVQRAAGGSDHAAARAPALIFYATGDQVVLPAATEDVIARWGAPVNGVILQGADDPGQHVITGDLLSPSTTETVITQTLDWLRAQRIAP